MNAEGIRQFFDYHYALWDRVWSSMEAVSEAQFVADQAYSIGSLRSQLVHQMDVDQGWISLIRSEERPDRLNAEDFADKAAVHKRWNEIEARVRDRLKGLDAELLSETRHLPLPPDWGGPQEPQIWQVLLHMVNHGTDHRAQVLRLLSDMGAETFDQDFMIHLWQSGQTTAG